MKKVDEKILDELDLKEGVRETKENPDVNTKSDILQELRIILDNFHKDFVQAIKEFTYKQNLYRPVDDYELLKMDIDHLYASSKKFRNSCDKNYIGYLDNFIGKESLPIEVHYIHIETKDKIKKLYPDDENLDPGLLIRDYMSRKFQEELSKWKGKVYLAQNVTDKNAYTNFDKGFSKD